MTGHRRYYDLSNARRRFQRKDRDGIILGVCAGVADFFSLDRSIVRLVALLLLWLFTIPTLLLYFTLAWLGDTR